MASRIDELYNEYKKLGTAQRDADIAASDKVYDTQRQQTQNTYNRQIDETSKAYEDLYDENAVQRLINEREVAENMANLGLTDSGLNRTQQTAVQLSYANSKNKIDVTRQKAIDTLTASLADAISKIDTDKLSAAENIRSSYDNSWRSSAQSTYATELEEETKRQKQAYDYSLNMYKEQQAAYEKQLQAQKEASYIIPVSGSTLRRDFSGSLKDNGVSVVYDTSNTDSAKWTTTYVDKNSGKKTVLPYNVNPYTGTVNPDTANGVWDNGYQPDNIKNEKLKAAKDTDGNKATAIVNGREQTIFKCSSGYYLWHGAENKYYRLTRAECIQNGIYVDKWYDQ